MGGIPKFRRVRTGRCGGRACCCGCTRISSGPARRGRNEPSPSFSALLPCSGGQVRAADAIDKIRIVSLRRRGAAQACSAAPRGILCGRGGQHRDRRSAFRPALRRGPVRGGTAAHRATLARRLPSDARLAGRRLPSDARLAGRRSLHRLSCSPPAGFRGAICGGGL